MKVRIIFGTYIDDPDREGRKIELEAGDKVDLDAAVALPLIKEGRVEPVDPSDKEYQAWLKKTPGVAAPYDAQPAGAMTNA